MSALISGVLISFPAMAQIINSEHRYGTAAIALHWLMAGILVTLVILGVYMVQLPDAGFDQTKIRLILFHKELGILAFLLAALRLAWRVGNVLPRLVEGMPEWQKVAARFVHFCFYGLMFAQPITGWLMSSAAGIPVSFFGLFFLPDFIPRDDYLFQAFVAIHRWLGYAFIFLILAHVGAALRHHFLLRDDTLAKMLPTTERCSGKFNQH